MSASNSESGFTLSEPLFELLDMGGPVMAILLILSVVGLATALYTVVIGVFYAPRASRPLQTAVSEWCQGQHESARNRLAGSRNTLAALLGFAMHRRLRGDTEASLREEVSRRARQLILPFESPLKIMEVIAALAPLLGLLGTVMGMMTAFNAMAATDGQANPSELSGGIYEALSTTAAGLIVAIPFAAFSAFVEFRMRRMQEHINDMLVRLFQAELPESHDVAEYEAATSKESGYDSDDGVSERRHAMA